MRILLIGIVMFNAICIFLFLPRSRQEVPNNAYSINNYIPPAPSCEPDKAFDYELLLEKPGATPAFPDWKPGPLAQEKYEIAALLESNLQTGDILFRSSNALAANGMRFSDLVEWATESDFSHACIVLRENNKVYILEVDDRGVHLMRFIDWLDTPSDPDFAIYRYHHVSEELKSNIKREIDWFLINRPPYDFTFDDPNKFYCTECVIEIYKRCGIHLCEPKMINEILGTWSYRIFQQKNAKSRKETGQAMPEDEPLYFVGNEKHGMMSSNVLHEVYRHAK